MRADAFRRIGSLGLAFGLMISTVSRAQQAHTIARHDGKQPDMSKPVQVYILLGQSNMLGFGKVDGDQEGSLTHAVKTKKLYPYLVDEAGSWIERKDVRNVRVMVGKGGFQLFNNEWMKIGKGNIGPEFGIGHHLGNALDAPVMILKSCIGNRSLGWDLLPPGTEPYEHDGKMQPGYRGTPDNPKGTGEKAAGWYAGKQYDDDIENAKKVLSDLEKYFPGAKSYEVAGFFWWQGDKDFRNAAHSAFYEKNLVQFIKALRKDFNAPNAKFVSATLGQTTKDAGGTQGQILKAKFAVADGAKYPEFKGSVAAVYSNPLSKGGSSSGHYSGHAETYMNVGEAMGWAMVQMLGNSGGGARPAAVTSSTSSSAAQPAKRGPRRIKPEDLQVIQQKLLESLVGLSGAGKLDQTPLRMSFTAANVWLKEVKADGTVTFGMVGGDRTAAMAWTKILPQDHAVLAMYAAQVSQDDADVQGMAGVYAELLGNLPQSEAYFGKAGGGRAKWEACLY